jgi:hypothetical protein
MHDDELLRRLAEAVREDEREERGRLDPRWDELAAGRLPAEEEAALRREAEGAMAASEALAAFTSLGDDFRARVVREARERLGAPAFGREEGRGIGTARPADERGAGAPRRPRRSFRLRRWWPAVAALAAAALLLVVWPGRERAPLPGYEVALRGQIRSDRSPAAAGAGEQPWEAPRAFAPGNRFELVLRPERTVDGRLEVRTYRQEGGDLLPWPLPLDGPHDGAVRIAGTVGVEIDLPAGETTLVVVVARRGELPAAEEMLARLGGGGRVETRGWLAWRQVLALQPAEGR